MGRQKTHDADPQKPAEEQPIGIVSGLSDASPAEFWLVLRSGALVQQDDFVVAESVLPDGRRLRHFGVVDELCKRQEGLQFAGDAFRVADGLLPAEHATLAHVRVTRIEPEVFTPPEPGAVARLARGEELASALYLDRMERRLPLGLTRAGDPVHANLEFFDGTRGAHVSISGISGVATKTTFATWLLYALFHSDALGSDVVNTKAIIINVKGEDHLWLDRPNVRLTDEARREYERLGLPAGPFRSVGLYAPARAGSALLVPDTGGRQEGIRAYAWTLREFARDGLLRLALVDGNGPSQVGFVAERVVAALQREARQSPNDVAWIDVNGTKVRSFAELVTLLDGPALDAMAQGIASGTLDAFRRRLHATAHRMGHLVRGDDGARGHGIDWSASQVTVIDVHTLHSSAQTFVVGAILKQLLDQKEAQGTARPLVFVMLDELNKYAPREGSSPLSEILLDIAERGRSLGVSLLGAQQTASEVERRVVANAALRVVGRLDAAEAERHEYKHLGHAARQRATLLQPGSMLVSQPDIPSPVLIHFPFPAWATRASEAAPIAGRDPFARSGN